MKFIAKIQQIEFENHTLPYPYFIDTDGFVGRQDFWNGKPYKLLGFHDKPISGDIKLSFETFKLNIKKAIGMYPVFEHKDGEWTTHKSPVEFIRL